MQISKWVLLISVLEPNIESGGLSNKHWFPLKNVREGFVCNVTSLKLIYLLTNLKEQNGKGCWSSRLFHRALGKLCVWWTCWTKPLSRHHILLNHFKRASASHVAAFCHLIRCLICKSFATHWCAGPNYQSRMLTFQVSVSQRERAQAPCLLGRTH